MRNYQKGDIRDQVTMDMVFAYFGMDRGRGDNPTLKCEFHDDDTPSMSVNFVKNRFQCHSTNCNAHGDVIDFYMLMKNLSFYAACNEIGKVFNVNSSEPTYSKAKQQVNKPSFEIPGDDVLEVYQYLYDITEQTYQGKEYLEGKRGFRLETIKKFGLHAIDYPGVIKKRLEKEFGRELLKKCGLENGAGNFIFYKPGVLIPYFVKDRIVYYQYRFYKEFNENKYFFLAKVKKPYYTSDLHNRKQIVAVEGVFDAMALYQLDNDIGTIAVGGTLNYDEDKIRDFINRFEGISRYDYELVYSPDWDDAGRKVIEGIKDNSIEIRRLDEYCREHRIEMTKADYDWNDVLIETA